MKEVTYKTYNGLNLPLGVLTTDVDWFLEEIERTDRKCYMKIFTSPKVSRRLYQKAYQDETDTFIVVTDCYDKKTFLRIKEDRYEL